MVNTIKKSQFKFKSYFSFFSKKKSVSTKTGGGAKEFLSKLSGAFPLPISVLAIAGLFLGVGATIAGNSGSNSAVKTFGEFIKQLGGPLFGALPLLFAAAIAVSFTEEAGIAVFNAIIGYVIFSGLQSVFIFDVTERISMGIDSNGNLIMEDRLIGYNVMFGGLLRTPESLKSIVGNSLGFKVLQTSVFGGIIVGFCVQYAYNKFHTIQLPQVISFFGGKRFVAFSVIIFMIPLAFIFLILWPYIGYAFNWIGTNSGKIPFGFDSFIFGFIERSLVPFGLHHAFYSPLWYTAAGADVASELNSWLAEGNNIVGEGQLKDLASVLKGTVGSLTIDGKPITGIVGASVVGDSTTSLALIGFNSNTIQYRKAGGTNTLSKSLFMFIQDELDLKIGRFLQGKFSFIQWGLPFAGLAMVLAAPKENRNVAIGVVFPAAVTCFITGVTEPLEFTFLFLAPLMFFGFHTFMCALSFMLMNILSVHIAQAFSGGFLDLMIYGAVPVLKGTNFWWTIVVGAGYAPIYFFVFYFWIKKADLQTPGRGGNTKLFTKKDYLAQKEGAKGSLNDSIDPQALKIIEGFGGKDNILKTANCASRLRFDVKNADKVSEDKLKEAGAFGLRRISDSHVQVIFGAVSEQLKIKVDKILASNIDVNNSLVQQTNNVNKNEDVCEGCSDHVCNDNCGCELSDAAKRSLERDKKNKHECKLEYLSFLNKVGGLENIKQITRIKDDIVFDFIDSVQDYDNIPGLYNAKSIEKSNDKVQFTYDNAVEIKNKIIRIHNDLQNKL